LQNENRPLRATVTTAAALVAVLIYGHWRLGQTFGEGVAVDIAVVQGGATPAELPALRAFLERPDLDAVRASSVEVYGDCDPPPQAIVMLRGVDPNIGLITKYGLIEPHAD